MTMVCENFDTEAVGSGPDSRLIWPEGGWVHAASELTAVAAVAAERPSGPDRVQWNDRMGTKTG
jgi:hypothetical protein